MADPVKAIAVIAGQLGTLSMDVRVTAMTPDTAKAYVKGERARYVWPVAIMCGALVVISAALIVASLTGKMSDAVALAVALMVAPASTATVWKLLTKR